MPYVNTKDRNQIQMISLDSLIDQKSEARIIDAFIDTLDMEKLGFKYAVPAKEGRPAYNPRHLLKLYVYGSQNDIRSSRKLQKACQVNLEVMWLMNGVTPDFRTISDFRKDNRTSMKKAFESFNQLLRGEVETEYLSVDGSKFFASNSKDRNFTRNKLDDRIEALEGNIDEYLRQLDLADQEEETPPGSFTEEELNEKLSEAQERLGKYKSYQEKMDEENLSQLSLTDPDARLMKMRNGFGVAYNVQTAVTSTTHMIADYNVTSAVTDYGQLAPTLAEYKEKVSPDGILEAVADKGYQSEEDIRECLEKGIVPHVILPKGKDAYEIYVPYEDNAQCKPESTDAEEIRKCLHAGKVPEAYHDIIKATVTNKRIRITEEPSERATSPFADTEEMKAKAAEGYFVRDPEKDIVHCPGGFTLRRSYVTKKERIRYTNKLACRTCPYRNQCYKANKGFKEVEFNKDEFIKPNGNWLKAEGKEVHFQKTSHKYKTVKVVKLVFRPDRKKMAQRMCLSEHPFGTIKRTMNGSYFLLRGTEKVDGEFALLALGYNIRRAVNYFGFDKIMELIKGISDAFYSVFKDLVQNLIWIVLKPKNLRIKPLQSAT